MRRWAALTVMLATPAAAQLPATVRMVPSEHSAAADFRLTVLTARATPMLDVNDPQSPLQRGYGGNLVDLFPFADGDFHLSAGSRLWGRPRRPEPDTLSLLAGPRGQRLSRRFSPAMLVGYGRTVERGLSMGVDAGLALGRVMQAPDRFGRFSRERLGVPGDRSPRDRGNPLARVTALYRF